jgi:uncharacterized protein YndB with AHSA1/START domain
MNTTEISVTVNPGEPEITYQRILNAPRELVFEVWTQPQHITKWWGPNGFTNTTQQMDVRSGGVWDSIMHGPDGTDYKNHIVYDEVTPPERLVFTNVSGKFQSVVTFEKHGNQTRLTMQTIFESAEQRDRTIKAVNAVEGGKQTLGRLVDYLAEMQLVVTRKFNAPAELVFDAWLDADAVGNWLFTTPESKIDSVKIDPRVGGEFEIIDKRGEELTRHIGTYLEIDRPRRLVFTFAVPQYSTEFTTVTIDIAPLDSGCELTLTHEGVLPEWRDKTIDGWTMILNGLAENLT